MRSLFLKIFLWYWATVIIVGLALGVIVAVQPEIVTSRWRAAVGSAVSIYAQSAVEELERSGAPGLQGYLHRLDTNAHIHAAILDENFNLISGRVPAAAHEILSRAARSGQTEFQFSSGNPMVAQPVVGPSGRKYLFAAELPRPPSLGYRLPFRHPEQWAVALIVSGLICYLLTRYLTRPMLDLRTAASRLASGDLSARAKPALERRHDEIGELVRDFNEMAERLEVLLKSQQQLISDISHELRSPLARLTVALGLARQRDGLTVAPQLDRIERETERLNEMIGKLLSLAKMDAASAPPDNTHVSLRDVVTEVVDDATFEAQERQCSVRLNAPQDCSIVGSEELLRSAVENVVRNALKYTASGSEVLVDLKCSQDQSGRGWGTIIVRDHGNGVPDAELTKLFRPFYRVTSDRDRKTGGTGLGLAITQRAVRLHGGTVRATNALDGGLVVEIQLPAAAIVLA